MNRPLVACRDLSVELGGVSVLKGLSLSVYEGDFLGIVGPNGGGKTTLLRVILGLERPSSGQVSVFGGAAGSAFGKIGYVPQRLFFDRTFPLSVRELVQMGRLAKRRWFRPYGRDDRERVDEALATVGLDGLADRMVGALSGGELQRALIARALAGEPQLLLLDEPTASVDPSMRTSIYDLLDRLHEELTIVMVTHDTGTIGRHVSRIACLNCTLDLLEPGSSLSSTSLEELYGHPVDIIVHKQ